MLATEDPPIKLVPVEAAALEVEVSPSCQDERIVIVTTATASTTDLFRDHGRKKRSRLDRALSRAGSGLSLPLRASTSRSPISGSG